MVLVGNHGLQKRPPPLAVTFFRTGNKHVSLAPNYRVLKNPVWCGFTWKEVHRWFEGGLGRIAVVHVHDRGTGRHGFRANGVHLDAPTCNCVHELLAKLVQCIRYSSVCLLPAWIARSGVHFSGIGAWRIPAASSINWHGLLEEDHVANFVCFRTTTRTRLCFEIPSKSWPHSFARETSAHRIGGGPRESKDSGQSRASHGFLCCRVTSRTR